MRLIISLTTAITLLAAGLPLFSQDASHPKRSSHAQHAQSHAEQMQRMFGTPKLSIKNVGILVYDGFTTLDAMGPYQVLSEMMGVNVFFVARTKGIVRNMAGMKMQVDVDINDVDSLDILVIPGGLQGTYKLTGDSTLLAWIRKIDKTSTYTTSVCTGAWILGATGLLKGKNATTHWYGKEILATDYGVKVNKKKQTDGCATGNTGLRQVLRRGWICRWQS
jgi:putative intracellular protease/amidase